jgi:hypothetical protein
VHQLDGAHFRSLDEVSGDSANRTNRLLELRPSDPVRDRTGSQTMLCSACSSAPVAAGPCGSAIHPPEAVRAILACMESSPRARRPCEGRGSRRSSCKRSSQPRPATTRKPTLSNRAVVGRSDALLAGDSWRKRGRPVGRVSSAGRDGGQPLAPLARDTSHLAQVPQLSRDTISSAGPPGGLRRWHPRARRVRLQPSSSCSDRPGGPSSSCARAAIGSARPSGSGRLVAWDRQRFGR